MKRVQFGYKQLYWRSIVIIQIHSSLAYFWTWKMKVVFSKIKQLDVDATIVTQKELHIFVRKTCSSFSKEMTTTFLNSVQLMRV